MNHTRRAALVAGGSALASVAGCLGVVGGGTETETLQPAGGGGLPSETATTPATGTDAGTGTDSTTTATGDGATPGDYATYELPDHPATMAVDAQPALGAVTRPGVIIAFEDPSCPRCKRFERATLPDIRSKLIDTGKAALVWRGYPVVYQWGKPATRALEATFDRNEAAFWRLVAYYFRNQGDIRPGNVHDRTRTYLNSIGIDGDAVVDDVKSGAYDDAVNVDLEAGNAAGAGSTPTFFLFRDGKFQTKVTGPQDYAVFANALGF